MLPAGVKLHAGMGFATVLPDCDFETYSEAGFVWDAATQKWGCPRGAKKKGLFVVGAAAYAEHPSTEVLSFYYDLKDGGGRRFWRPGMSNPYDLFAHVAAGKLLEAWNSGFEYWIWNRVCVRRYGWPALPIASLRCAMAKARAHALPGALDKAGEVLALQNQKNPDGDRLLKKFSMPRNPTKKEPVTRFLSNDDPVDGPKLYAYNERDIVAEAEASSRVPDLEGEELQYWLVDQAINRRGVQIDIRGVHDCIAVIDQAHERYNRELYALTGGAVARASELAKLQAWLFSARGVQAYSLDEENIDTLLENPELDLCARRALEIRQAIGSAAVKKVYAMANQATRAGRLHDLFSYHAARTGRATGNGPQPTNLPNSGPPVLKCGCGRHFGGHLTTCPWCLMPQPPGKATIEWGAPAVVDALAVIACGSLDLVEQYFGDAMAAVSGCLRGLFISAPGHDLICSDYSAIEAVVLAEIAGEEWRREVFRTHGKIYEMSAAKITGISFDEFMRYKQETGNHHPMRKKIGKIAELAFGFQGWIGAAKAFGMDEFFNDEEIKQAILAWRAASPAIVEFWGGQERRVGWDFVPEMYGVEGMFVSAILNPGHTYEFRGFQFTMRGDAVYLRLLSGRYLTYHRPRVQPGARRGLAISYEGNNTNPKNGPVGWVRMDTWGGRLTENIVQATARDVQRHGLVNLEAAGYPIVLHVYDEDIAEVPEGFGSIEDFERIMSTMPPWAAGWPIKAVGGWRGKRYRKD
jgi:DNA polymerase